MAVNLAKAYSKDIDRKFVLDSFVAGKVSTKYNFIGVNSLTIYNPVTKTVGSYTRSGENRFGTVTEMQDTIQTLTLTQDIAWTMSIDKGNNEDQLNIKGAGEMLKIQLEEQVIPTMDMYALNVFAKQAGKSAVIAQTAKATIVGLLTSGLTSLRNAKVPMKDIFIFVGATQYEHLLLATELIAVEPMAVQQLGNGLVGKFMGHMVVAVPDDYLPVGVQFMIWHKNSVIMPRKIRTLRILTDVQGIDGAVLEGRDYYDAFVLMNKANGIYTGVLTANKVATPVITPTGASHAVGVVAGVSFFYTVDGTDPRYSATAVAYSSAVVLTSGQTIKVFGKATDGSKCWSDVASALYTA